MRAVGLGLVLSLVLVGTTVCGGGGDGGGGSPPGGATVTGTVIGRYGEGVPVVPVAVEGHPAVLTDAAGRFRVEGVSVPYTIVLVLELGQRARVIRGLTRLDPIFRIEGPVGTRSAALAGTTSGGVGFPSPPDHFTAFRYDTTASSVPGSGSVDTATGAWSVPVLRWDGASSTRAQLVVLQVHLNASGLVDDFTGLATLDVPVGDGDSLSGLTFQLEAVDTVLVGGTVDVPPGYTLVGKIIYLRHTSGVFWPLPADDGPLNPFSLATVGVPDVSTTLLVSLATPHGGGVVVVLPDVPVPASNLSIDVPSETTLLSPNDGAVGALHETLFTVSPDVDRVYEFTWEPQGVGPEIELLTNDPVATPPDLTPYGLPVPSGEIYHWHCKVEGPGITVDDLAAGLDGDPAEIGGGFFQFTGVRPFTTGP